MDKIYDFEALINLLSTNKGGRSNDVFSGYRGAFALAEDWITTGEQDYIDVRTLSPGKSVTANVRILSPLDNCLWVGRKIPIQEGSKVIGSATITKIFNEKLRKDS